MDTQKLSIAIQAFIKKQSANAAYYEENWNERKERKAYYQSFTKDVLAVYDALVRAHESINKLALVPESF